MVWTLEDEPRDRLEHGATSIPSNPPVPDSRRSPSRERDDADLGTVLYEKNRMEKQRHLRERYGRQR